MPTSLLQGRQQSRLYQSVTPQEAMRERIEQRMAAKAGREIGFMAWALKVPEPKAGRLDFFTFPFQKELYEEGVNEKEGVIQKATQVGISAWGVRWSLYHADTKGRTGLYVFPTQRDMWDFSTLRIKPTIDASVYLKSRQRPEDPDNKGMRGIGLGKVVFRGSESKRGLDSVDCDHIVFDEYDTLDWDNIPDAEMRVSSPLSPGLIRRIGVPSDTEAGINALYEASDQRKWIVKCGHCGEQQDLDFFQNVDMKRAIRICRKCQKSIEEVIGKGEWVAIHGGEGRTRGYHVSRLIVPTADIGAMIKASKKSKPYEKRVFYNKHLGLPFDEAENRLTRAAIAAAQEADGGYFMQEQVGYNGTNLVTAGVDMASVRDLNVRISEHVNEDAKRALFIGRIERMFSHESGNGPSLEELMQRFNVGMMAIDHLPDGRLSRQFAERFAGKVFVVHFDSNPVGKDMQVIKVDPEMMTASIKRTPVIDATFEMIRQQRNMLPRNLPEGYIEEMRALIRRVIEDEKGKRVVRYQKSASDIADDFAFAEAYDLAATELWIWMQTYGSLMAVEETTADDLVDFERSHLAEYGVPGAGADEDYYEGGRVDGGVFDDDDHRFRS